MYVALLRGVNVGGKHRVEMKALKTLFEEAGCGDVRTYIQSGNVIFSASSSLLLELAETAPVAIEKRFGCPAPVILRSAEELRRVVRDNPFGLDDTKVLHVLFLNQTPSPALVEALDSQRSPGDEFVARGKEVYLRLPNGVGQTKLTNAYFESKLKVLSTGRNWRTVTKLLELASEAGE